MVKYENDCLYVIPESDCVFNLSITEKGEHEIVILYNKNWKSDTIIKDFAGKKPEECGAVLRLYVNEDGVAILLSLLGQIAMNLRGNKLRQGIIH